MPTDPSSANQSNPAGPLGQAPPSQQRIPQRQLPTYPFAQHSQQQPHPTHLHPSQQPAGLPHSQYGISPRPTMHQMSSAQSHQPTPPPHQAPQQQRGPMSQPQPHYFPVNGYQQINSYPGPVPAQQFQMAGYIYPGHAAYHYPLPATNAPQQNPVNSRAARQYTPPVSSNPAQRNQPGRIPVVPPRKKNILQIVDPDTNEEVKVSKVDSRPRPVSSPPSAPQHAPIKIPPRKSHALELVSDPADKSQASNGTKKETVSSQEPSTGDSSVTDESANGGNLEAERHDAAATPAKAEANLSPLDIPTDALPSSSKTPAIEVSDAKVKQEVLTISSPKEASSDTVEKTTSRAASTLPHTQISASESTQTKSRDADSKVSHPVANLEAVRTDEGATIAAQNLGTNSNGQAPSAVSASVSNLPRQDARENKGTPSANSVKQDSSLSVMAKKEAPKPETRTGDQQPPPSSSPVEKKDQRVAAGGSTSRREVSRDVFTALKKESSLIQNVKADPETASLEEKLQRLSLAKHSEPEPSGLEPVVEQEAVSVADEEADPSVPEGPVFAEGDRRVYVPSYMWSMREKPNTDTVPEYQASLGSGDLLKDGSSSSANWNFSRPAQARVPGPITYDPRRAFPGQSGAGFQVPVRGAAPPGIGGVGAGSYDPFDLRSARSQAPPPAPKGQSSARDGDPRGSRQQVPRGRFDSIRQGQTPVDPFIIHVPVEKLKRSDKGWKRNKDADDEVTAKVKSVRSLLNKLTLEKFEKIFKQIVDVGISSYDILDGIVKEIFEKTLFEPKFSGMYAELCRRLELSLRDALIEAGVLDPDGNPISFRKILIKHCRDEFTSLSQSAEENEEANNASTEATGEKNGDVKKTEEGSDKKLTPEEKEAKEKLAKEEENLKAVNAKRRMLANIRFIGELFLKDLLRRHIIHKQCIQKLLAIGIETKEEDILEALCKLISKTGAKLSEDKEAIGFIDQYFKPLHSLAKDRDLPARIRFMIQDLIEQRANDWKVRREEVGAKTIAEIHKDVEKEERAKQEAQAAARDRRNRGGGMHGRDRHPQGFPPRVVAMTMASSRRTAPNVSRTNSVIEKFGNRSSSTVPNNNLQGVRLGPGGTRLGPGGGPSSRLRPGSSSNALYGAFAPLHDGIQASQNGQSSAARRVGGKGTKIPAIPRRTTPPSKQQPESPDRIKQKTRGILQEFWSTGYQNEVREVLVAEVKAASFAAFLEEAIRLSIDAKVDQSEKSLELFRELAIKTIPGSDFVNAFSALVGVLGDLELDNPRVTDFLGRYIGSVASTRKLPGGDGPSFGLEFVATALRDSEDPKRVTKMIVFIFASIEKELKPTVPKEADRWQLLKGAYRALGIDVAGLMSFWNPMRGLSSLEDMLKSNGVSFLTSHLDTEQKLKGVMSGGATAEGMLDILKTCSSQDEELMRAVVRLSFGSLLMSPAENLQEAFSSVMGSAIRTTFGPDISESIQMAALLETQSFVTKNVDILPPLKVGELEKPGSIAFDLLHRDEIVSEKTCMQWKEDTQRSVRVGGKDKMIIQTSPFFHALSRSQG